MIVKHRYDAVRSAGHRTRWAQLGVAPFLCARASEKKPPFRECLKRSQDKVACRKGQKPQRPPGYGEGLVLTASLLLSSKSGSRLEDGEGCSPSLYGVKGIP